MALADAGKFFVVASEVVFRMIKFNIGANPPFFRHSITFKAKLQIDFATARLLVKIPFAVDFKYPVVPGVIGGR